MDDRDHDDAHRFEKLVREHRRIVLHVARAYASGPDDRRDLAQDIALAAWRGFRGYDAGRPFATWLYRVALNTGISHMRHRARESARTEPLDDERLERLAAPTPEEADPRAARLHACIAELGPLDRALVLLWLEDRAYDEIAEVLGLSTTNVATRLNRLKAKLAQRMRAQEG